MPGADIRNTTATRFVTNVTPHIPQLAARARALTPSRFDAEDLLQDTLIKAYVSFDSFDEGSNARAWMFRVMYTTWISNYRARQRRPAEVLTDGVGECSTAVRSAEDQVLESLGDDEISELFCELPLDSRTAVYLADIHGLAYREIAELMHTPLGTVMSRIHRGRKRLRPLLRTVAERRGVLVGAPESHDGRLSA